MRMDTLSTNRSQQRPICATSCPSVPQNRAALGIALDPDSDRLALIDETGRYIGEELTLALAVQQRLHRTRGPVVINMSTSRLVEDIAGTFGCVCHRSAVGEANVADKMIEVSATIGGEGNGGVIDPRVGYVRDPFIGLGLILNLMARHRKDVESTRGRIAGVSHRQGQVHSAAERLTEALAALQHRWPDSGRIPSTAYDWTGTTAGSTSGPATRSRSVRVIAEARDVQSAKEYAAQRPANFSSEDRSCPPPLLNSICPRTSALPLQKMSDVLQRARWHQPRRHSPLRRTGPRTLSPRTKRSQRRCPVVRSEREFARRHHSRPSHRLARHSRRTVPHDAHRSACRRQSLRHQVPRHQRSSRCSVR